MPQNLLGKEDLNGCINVYLYILFSDSIGSVFRGRGVERGETGRPSKIV